MTFSPIFSVLFSRADDAPDTGTFVVGNKKAAIFGDRKLGRRAPHGEMVLELAGESRNEVVISAGWHTVLEPHANNLVAIDLVIAAQSMQGDKAAVPIFRPKLP